MKPDRPTPVKNKLKFSVVDPDSPFRPSVVPDKKKQDKYKRRKYRKEDHGTEDI